MAASPPLDPPDPVVGVRVNPDPDLFRITLELESDGFPDPDTEPTDFLFFALATEVAVETKLCARLLFTLLLFDVPLVVVADDDGVVGRGSLERFPEPRFDPPPPPLPPAEEYDRVTLG